MASKIRRNRPSWRISSGAKKKAIEDQWWKEDDLINQRITWLLTAHALLCTGFAWLRYRTADVKLETITKLCLDSDCTPQCKNDFPLPEHVSKYLDYASKYSEYVSNYLNYLEDLMMFVAGIGIAVSVFVGLGIFAACLAQNILKFTEDNGSFRLGISKLTTNLGRFAAISFPMLCCGSWFYMLYTLRPNNCLISYIVMIVIVLEMIVLSLTCFEWEWAKKQIDNYKWLRNSIDTH